MVVPANMANPDCWAGVKDPRERKKIQDRLAQRARRKRIAQGKSTTAISMKPASLKMNSVKFRRQDFHSLKTAEGFDFVIASSTASSDDSSDTMSPIDAMPLPYAWYTALYKNGKLMNLTCAVVIDAVSKNFGTAIPETLRPTALQLSVTHPTWIDRFPFPHMRDNFISLLGVIDPEEFINDIFSMPSFRLTPGDTWDPRVWRIEEAFAKKWGFLFDPNLLQIDDSGEEMGILVRPKPTSD